MSRVLLLACGAKVVAIFLHEDEARWGHPGERFRAARSAGEAVTAALGLSR